MPSVLPEQFPPRFTANLREELPDLADRIIAAIADEVPSYALPLEGSFGRGIWHGVTGALRRFLDMLDGTTPGELGAYAQPAAWGDGIDSIGTVDGLQAGTVGGNDILAGIPIGPGQNGTGYLFGERGATVTGQV